MLRDIEVHVVQVGHPSAANPDRAEGLITSMCGGLGANGPGDASATSRDSPALDDSVLTSGCLWLHRYTVTPIPDTECPLARLGKTRPQRPASGSGDARVLYRRQELPPNRPTRVEDHRQPPHGAIPRDHRMRIGGFLRSAQQEVADEFDRLFER